ncbi:GTPase [Arenibacter sp. 6A1]|uniref:GTPase n=1 Tax=Arenibacter sp. 6A1 TaxID=2720391 RepID=UPI00144858D0|nr:GTPase [Arenibacter sp. 6A1]NKI25688.1 GTPase [Arenibacter sp. 6A1]
MEDKELQTVKTLMLVYKADSGIGNAILDSVHKIWSPNTYQCKLCELTHGVFVERKVWKEFRKKTAVQLNVLHRDEFQEHYGEKYGYNFSFPVILCGPMNNLRVYLSSIEINALESPEDLIRLILGKEEKR